MKQIPLFGSGVNSYSAIVSRQRRLNCFYDTRTDGEVAQQIIRGTPGWTAKFTLPASPIRGWLVSNGLLYVVGGSALYSVNAYGNAAKLGSLTGNSFAEVSMADNGAQLIIVDGVAGYIYTYATAVFSVISDASFPNGAQTVAFLDGRFLCNLPNTKQCYISNLYAGQTWSPAVYFSKENSSDYLIRQDVWNGNIILWGSVSIEFWQDVGASPNPFARVTGSSQTWGLAALWSVAQVSNTVVFLGQNPQGSVQVMILNGYTPSRISTTDIENIINSFPVFNDAVALTYLIDGHAMYQLTFPAGGRSFLFDASTGSWSEVQTGVALLGRHFAQLGIVFNAQNYVCDTVSGAIYQMDENAYTDAGQTIKRQVTTQHLNTGGNTFEIAEIYFDMETGVGLATGQGSNPKVMLQVSKDNGRTFGSERVLPIGQMGQFKSPRVVARRFGKARDFVFQLTMTDPVKFTIGYGAATIDASGEQ